MPSTLPYDHPESSVKKRRIEGRQKFKVLGNF
jgi:hypothetical protein